MKTVKELVGEANSQIETLTVQDAIARHGNAEYLFVDIRDEPELRRDGMVNGALHVSRGMLEFVADPNTPYHKPELASGRTILLYCASGGRSALAAKALKDMGIEKVAHVAGGFKAWKEANGPTGQLG